MSLGLPDGLLGVALPSMPADFALPLDALGMLRVANVQAGYLDLDEIKKHDGRPPVQSVMFSRLWAYHRPVL